ncbi:MAG: hypothetical protein M8861_02460 [marine benthic group bacterium]|nr:hypothetical protein [Gemmatimonadota bacterium]
MDARLAVGDYVQKNAPSVCNCLLSETVDDTVEFLGFSDPPTLAAELDRADVDSSRDLLVHWGSPYARAAVGCALVEVPAGRGKLTARADLAGSNHDVGEVPTPVTQREQRRQVLGVRARRRQRYLDTGNSVETKVMAQAPDHVRKCFLNHLVDGILASRSLESEVQIYGSVEYLWRG